jgi:16S rRNA (cytidine1402-2'-O)-methyltransferase
MKSLKQCSIGLISTLFLPRIIGFSRLANPLLSRGSLYSTPSLIASESYSTGAVLNSSSVEPGHVYFVATPLGNLKDMTTRAIEVLSTVDMICAEDTRHTVKLLRHLSLPHKDLLSHHEHNWKEQIPKILSMVQEGKSLAVVSDAGTPGICDPGAELAEALLIHNVPLHPIPGPSAVVAALSVCGFQASEFSFLGFLAVKGKERTQKLDQIVRIQHPVVIYEAPHRMKMTFRQLASKEYGQGQRPCVCCRELTKMHEEFKRGNVDECLAWLEKFDDNDVSAKSTLAFISFCMPNIVGFNLYLLIRLCYRIPRPLQQSHRLLPSSFVCL